MQLRLIIKHLFFQANKKVDIKRLNTVILGRFVLGMELLNFSEEYFFFPCYTSSKWVVFSERKGQNRSFLLSAILWLRKEKRMGISFSSSSLFQRRLNIDSNLCFLQACLKEKNHPLPQHPLLSGFKCQVHFSIERKKLR